MPSKIILTQEQEVYLRENYQDTMNTEIAKNLGVSISTLERMVRERGLSKSEEGRKKINAERAKLMSAERRRRGTYYKGVVPKGFVPFIRHGVTLEDRVGKARAKEAYAKMARTKSQRYNEDRIRVKWGLPQLTKMKVSFEPLKKRHQKDYLRRRGYIVVDKDFTAYWTPETRRAVRLEKQPRRYYHFREYAV